MAIYANILTSMSQYQFFCLHASLVDSAGCHQQLEWIMLKANTEVAPCSITPAPTVQKLHRLDEIVSRFLIASHRTDSLSPL